MKHSIKIILVATMLTQILNLATAHAACTVAGNTATPFQAGPPNPNNGFAEYLRDSNGLALELCLSPSQPTLDPVTLQVISPVGAAPFCFFDPPDPANTFSNQIGFGAEGFWWLASPDTRNFPATMNAVLVLGAEAAFLADVVDGAQFPFTRLRIVLDVPVAGYYRVTEPYGVHTYNIQTLVAGREVFDSFDVEFSQGSIDNAGVVTEATSTSNCTGPWLTWDTFASNDPALDITGDGIPDFIGDGATSHLITGSPTGNNLFRIEAFSDAAMTIPLNTLDPGDADGNGSLSSVETNLFTVVGKVYDGRLATPMVAERSTYARNGSGTIAQVDVFARAADTALVSLTGGPNINGTFPLTGLAGDYFTSTLLTPDASVVPSVVDIDATDGGAVVPTDPTHLIRPLTDQVNITRAEYDVGVNPRTLTIEATSSDTLASPTLTLVELAQPLVSGSIVLTDAGPGIPLAPPGVITVNSSAGGSATRLVEVVNSDMDADGVTNTADNCPTTANPGQEDTDADGVGDACDNCITVANGTLLPAGKAAISQRDTDADGFGNMCDADLNGSGLVTITDYILFRNEFGKAAPGVEPYTSADHADFDGNGLVTITDYIIFRGMYGAAPGPSALAP